MRAICLALLGLFFALPRPAASQPDSGETKEIHLTVPAGAPIRFYLTSRVSKRAGEAVHGRTIEPVFAFDREVVPAGSLVSGKISRAPSVSKWRRVQSVLNGDFTPLRNAVIQIDALTLPDGTKRAIHTEEAPALPTIFREPSAKKQKRPAQKQQPQPKPQNQNGGILGTARQTLKQKVDAEISSRTYGVADIVRAPNRKEKLIDFLWAHSPYHPQYLRRGTRVDAAFIDPLQFGSATLKIGDLTGLGAQPPSDSMGRIRLLTPLDSATAKVGDPVRASVSIPLFASDHTLALPEGTLLTGAVTVAKKARLFHRSGQLRFRFDNLQLPEDASISPPAAGEAPRASVDPQNASQPELKRREAAIQTQATLEGAEADGSLPIKVDSEGGVTTQESKTRFLAPAISLMIASRAADNDAGRNHATSGTGGEANVSGRTVGGLSGFGLVGAVSSQASKYVGMSFGYYGLAWSVYSNVVAKGGEIVFNRNAMMDVRFGKVR